MLSFIIGSDSEGDTVRKSLPALYKPAFVNAIAGKDTLINLIKGAYTIGPNANLQLVTDLENALAAGEKVNVTVEMVGV